VRPSLDTPTPAAYRWSMGTGGALGGPWVARSSAPLAVSVALHGPVPGPWASGLQDLRLNAVSVTPWPLAGISGEPSKILEWLAHHYSKRPLLGITAFPIHDSQGLPLRGISGMGTGLAVVSTHGLNPAQLRGVIRHEVAHAVGLPHCPNWTCALSERSHPMSMDDRGESLCPSCLRLWHDKTRRAPD
jgi:hypothetical protein